MDYVDIEHKLEIIINCLNDENIIPNAISSIHSFLDFVVSENEEKRIGMMLNIVIHGTNNLLRFIKEITNIEKNDFNELMKGVCEFLKCVVKDFNKSAEQFIPSIFDTCKQCITRNKSLAIKSCCYDLMIEMVQCSHSNFFNKNPGELNNMLNNEIFKNTNSSIEKKKGYQLIGVIVQSYPEKVFEDIPRLLRHIVHELILQMINKEAIRITELEGLFECLLAILNNFSDIAAEHKEKLYTIMKTGCEFNISKKTIIKVAFTLFRQKLQFFVDYVYDDYNWWFEKLQEYLRSFNKNDNTLAVELLDLFYIEMANVLKKKSNIGDKRILQFFIGKLQNNLKSYNNSDVISAIKNFGNFSEACEFHKDSKSIDVMLELTTQIAEKYCFGFENEYIQLHYVSDILLSLTKIIKSSSNKIYNKNELDILVRLTVFVIISFPKIAVQFQPKVNRTIIDAIINVAMINESFLDLYLDSVIYVALIKSCSHLMESDVEFVKESGEISKELITYKEYVKLWQHLCNIENAGYNFDFEVLEILHNGNIAIKIYDVFIISSLKIIKKLDFTVNVQNDNDLNTMKRTLKLERENDFYIFVNLVELFSQVILKSESEKLEKWTSRLITTFISCRKRYQIKSGFYQLLTVVFKKSTLNFTSELEINQLKFFLWNELIQIYELKGNDLVTCLQMIMNAPSLTISYLLPAIVPAFQILFNIGLKDISLAFEGLNTLQKWYFLLPLNTFKPTLLIILSYLSPLIQSKELVRTSHLDDKLKEKMVIAQQRKKKSQKYREISTLSKCDSELTKLQKEIIKFLGQIDTELGLSILTSNDFVTWEPSEILKFEVPFSDMKVKIFLDKLLPRIIELACNCGDVNTRLIACEVLHSVATIFIGNSAVFEKAYPKDATNIFKNLMFYVFKLGSDINYVVKQLFHPLSFQITHYYSSKLHYKGVVTNAYLDVIFDCASNNTDASLRNLAAELIEEFFKWSIKDNNNEEGIEKSSNISAIIKRICLFCLKSCSYKRLGAALAFNSIYNDIQKEEILLNIYGIKLLFYFVENISLSGDNDCNNEHTSLAINRIKRILCEKSHHFDKMNNRREVPNCLKTGTLNDIVIWLFPQCFSTNKQCRSTCMELISELSVSIKDTSLKDYKQTAIDSLIFFQQTNMDDDFVKHNDINRLINRKDLESLKKLDKWLKSLSSILHFNLWLLKENVISLDCETGLLESIKYFSGCIITTNLIEDFEHWKSELSFMNYAENFLECIKNVFFQILEIFSTVGTRLELFIGTSSWQRNLWDYFLSYLFQPSVCGAIISADENSSKILSSVLCNLEVVSFDIISKIQSYPYHRTFLNSFDEVLKNEDPVFLHHKHYLNVLNILQISSLTYSDIIQLVGLNKKDIVQSIYESLNRNGTAVKFHSANISFIEDFLSFVLQSDIEVEWLLSLIFNSSDLILRNTNCSISHGDHFFNTFKKPIIEFLNNFQIPLISRCLSAVESINMEKVRIILHCLQFTFTSKTQYPFDILITEIFKNWSIFANWNAITPNSTIYLSDIIKSVMNRNIKYENISDDSKFVVFSWLMNHLSDCNISVSLKKNLLDLLPFCINENSKENIDNVLRNGLQKCEEQCISVLTSDSGSNPGNIRKTIDLLLLNKLSFILCKTKNAVILELIICIIAANKNYMRVKNIRFIVNSIMKGTSVEIELQLLNTSFQFFKNENKSFAFRINCMQLFVIPLLNSALPETSKIFFSNITNFINEAMKKTLSSYRTQLMEKNILESGIGAILLLDTYYEKVNNSDCSEIKEKIFTDKSDLSKSCRKIMTKDVQTVNISNKEMCWKLKRFAYNLLIKIMKTKTELKFYDWLFKEDPSKNIYIWSNIINNEEELQLKILPDEISARKKIIIQKRKEIKKSMPVYSMPTEYLSCSSFVEDVVKFDMTEWNMSDKKLDQVNSNSYSIELEEDVINNHECMHTLCEVIHFMVANNIFLLPDISVGIPSELPQWMKEIKNSLEFYVEKKTKNVVIFILKLINNCRDIFYPYANCWLNVIIKSLLFLNEASYFTSDIIIMLLSWHKAVRDGVDETLANNLLDLLISQISYKEKRIRNYQLEVIKAVIEIWHESLIPPNDKLLTMIASNNHVSVEISLEISKSFLLKEVIPFDNPNRFRYMRHALEFTSSKWRSQKILSYEVLALIFRNVKKINDMQLCFEDQHFQQSLIDKLNGLKMDNVKTKWDDFFSCLHHILLYYPDILHNFIPYLLSNFKRFQGEFKIRCLKILSIDHSQLPSNTFSELMKHQFECCLNNNDYELLKSALTIIKLLMDQIEEKTLETILQSIAKLSTHDASDCRNLVYEIIDSIYLKYRDKTEERHSKVIIQCKAVLLNALFDKDTALQNKMFSSWANRLQVTGNISEQFLNVIKEMYCPLNESQFVCYAVDLLFEACTRTPDFESKIFDNPLVRCTYKNYEIKSSLCPKNDMNRELPIFEKSLSNQLFKLSSQYSNFSISSSGKMQKSLVFKPTVDLQKSTWSNKMNPSSVCSTSLDPNVNKTSEQVSKDANESKYFSLLYKLKNRFYGDPNKASQYYKYRNYKIKLKEQNFKNQVCIYRKYRIGDFPDIEISRSDVITPLRILAKGDAVIGKQIFISLFNGVVTKITEKKNFLATVNRIFNDNLKSIPQHDSIFLQTVFEIAFNFPEDIHLDPEQVVLFAHSNDLLSVGALLLENSITNKLFVDDASRTSKRLKTDQCSNDYFWIQLAELYKSLNESDVVNGILKEKITNDSCDTLKKGIELEQADDLVGAFQVYKNEIEGKLLTQFKYDTYYEHFILEAYFKCSAYLSEWQNLNKVIKMKFQDVNDLWKEDWHVDHTLLWYLLSDSYSAVKTEIPSDNFSIIESWLKEEDKRNILQNIMPEPLSIMLFMEGQDSRARVLVNDSIQLILEEWNHINITSEKLLKLQTLSEIENMLAVFSNSNESFSENVEHILKIWLQNFPGVKHLTWWDRRVAYRQFFTNRYLEKTEDTNICKSLENYKVDSALEIVESALYQNNYKVASNYIAQYFKLTHNKDSANLKNDRRFSLYHSKIIMLYATKCNSANKLEKLIESVDILSDKFSTANEYYQYEYLVHCSDVLSKIVSEISSSDNMLTNDMKSNLISIVNKFLSSDRIDEDHLINALRKCILENNVNAASLAENNNYSDAQISSAYLNIAKYYKELNKTDENLTNEKSIVLYILKAIKFNSKEASLLFPTLLLLKYIKDDQVKEMFISQCSQIEEWKFLTWMHQLFAYIDTDIVSVIRHLVLKIAEKYPRSVQFSFSLSKESFKFSYVGTETVIAELENKLYREKNTFDFVNALSFVCVPDIFFKFYIDRLYTLFKYDDADQIRNEYKKLKRVLCSSSNEAFVGRIFLENKFWNKVKECIDMKIDNINDRNLVKETLSEYLNELYNEKKSSDNTLDNLLKTFSPWLVKFTEMGIDDIEVPGQYSKFSIPDPDRHVKIFGFREKVKIIYSKQKPIKITIIGNDARDYPYLVKFGEDLRQDQRIQHIFSIMNHFISSDSVECSRKSQMIMYDVIPLKLNLGLIQWIENTVTLRNFMYHGLADERKKQEKKQHDHVRRLYMEYLRNISNKTGTLLEVYEQAVQKFSRVTTVAYFQKLQSAIPANIFTQSLLILSLTPNVYWHLRNQFIISYSTMAVCGWILGIGDRHLNNILVCLKTGSCFGIDFGISFGTGTECLQIPELIPFRVTPHIQSIMTPFNLTGLIRETMVNVLRTIRKNQYILLSDMQIFIVEPSLDWLNAAKKKEQEKISDSQIAEFKWYPKKRIENVEQKLHGSNPMEILVKEIKYNERINEIYRNSCIRLLKDETCARTKLPKENLKPVEQVDCLLDLATDECILGTSWEGLETWI